MVWKPSHTSGNPTLFLPRGSGAVTSHGTLLPASHHSAAGGQQHGGHSGGRGACTRRGQGCTLARLRHNHGSRPADHCPESVSARYRGSRGGRRHGRGRFVGGSTRSGCGRCQNRGRRGGGRRGGIRRGNHRGRRHQRGVAGWWALRSGSEPAWSPTGTVKESGSSKTGTVPRPASQSR